MARRLVFATVRCEATWRPPTATTATWQEGASTWQLIIGATLVRRMGGAAAETAMRRVKPGCVLRVTGRVQVNQNPKRQRAPDLVVSSLDIVATAERARQREKSRAEAARAAAAAAGRKAVEEAEALAASAATAAGAVTPAGGRSRLISRPFGMPGPVLVDSEETVDHFVGVVDRLCSPDRENTGDNNNNGEASQRYVGVDLEWRPTGLYPLTNAELAAGGGPRPAALLQIAPADGPPLVLDLFAMRQEGWPSMTDRINRNHVMITYNDCSIPTRQDATTTARVSAAVARLLSDARVTKLGFGLGELRAKSSPDRLALETALPGITAASTAVVDLQPIAQVQGGD